jgi:hypothetical protein
MIAQARKPAYCNGPAFSGKTLSCGLFSAFYSPNDVTKHCRASYAPP